MLDMLVKNTNKQDSENGFLIVAVVVLVLVLSVLTLGFGSMVLRETDILVVTQQQHLANGIAKAGLQRAHLELSKDCDWSDTPNPIYSSVSYGNGTYTVATSNILQDSITLTSTATFGNAAEILTQNIVFENDPNFQGQMTATVTGIHTHDEKLDHIKLWSNKPSITVDKIQLTFSEVIEEELDKIEVNHPDVTVWDGATPLGPNLDVDDFVITDAEHRKLKFFFDDNIVMDPSTTADLTITLTDGCTYTWTNIGITVM